MLSAYQGLEWRVATFYDLPGVPLGCSAFPSEINHPIGFGKTVVCRQDRSKPSPMNVPTAATVPLG
jgi:hypothetical protein